MCDGNGRRGGRFGKPTLHLPRRGVVTEKHLPPHVVEQFQLRGQPGTLRQTVVGDDGVMIRFDMPAVVNVAVQTIVFGRVDPVAAIKPHAVLVLRNLIGRQPAEFVAPHLARLQSPRGFRRHPAAVVKLLAENRAASLVIGIFPHRLRAPAQTPARAVFLCRRGCQFEQILSFGLP